ncbi:universal stress protein [Luteipulveratus mongoliensis]|uniref:UspA domain-containing protein n=1 Tax=Luteipulveratus mongoliensis TaxID=571913 RepID=A0A0K1JGV5_9MICO|nr:universal stress protein [Luteipulveratus mongoliensis]AKU15813.1 hypothetical protein VV02_08010 [Luteipulveratus mongoliensis]
MSAHGYVYVKGGDPHGPVVVGVDGSGTDNAAVAWAASAAALHKLPLHLLHSNEVAAVGAVQDDPTIASSETLDALRAQGSAPRVADELVGRVRAAHPDLEIVATETAGAASAALLAREDTALMLVVGSGRKGGLGERVLGTTSLNTAMHATCPVAVVNAGVDPSAPPKKRIAVGIDGSRDSAAAAEIAFAAAAARGSTVVCVSSWYLEVVDGFVVTDRDGEPWQRIEKRQRERVEAATKVAREAHPDVDVVVEVVNGPSTKVLAAQSEQSDVLVLGSRGRGGFTGKLLGSVSQKVLQAARCPVVIVKANEQG